MPLRYRITIVATFLLLPFVPAHAKEWEPSNPESTYLYAVGAGNIQKARDLAEIGNIDPANIAGHPLVAYLMNPWWGITTPALWNDAVFNYVFVELKQNPNTMPRDKEHTAFSSFCMNMLGTRAQDTDEVFHRTIERIHIALRLGAKTTEYPAKNNWEREAQPLPNCLDIYEILPADSPLKGELLQLIDLYLAKGANPNYRYSYHNLERTVPITVAIRHFDVPLLAVLIKNRANPKLTFKVDKRSDCYGRPARGSATDTLLADIPEPADRDALRAEAFLRAFGAAGGDITTPIYSCKHGMKSLKEMAVDNGQVEYARMATRLEKTPPTAADAPKLPDDFHYGGHTAHDSDDLAADSASPTRPSPMPAPSKSGSCPGPVISVQVEADAGKFNPPAWLAPDTTSGSLGINLSQKWDNLKGQHIALHCTLSGTMDQLSPHVEVVSVPDNMTTCTFAANLMTCTEEVAKKIGTAKAVSPATGFIAPDTTVTEANGLMPEADQQLRDMVYTTFGGETSQRFTIKQNIYTPSGAVGEILTLTVNPKFENACRVRYKVHTHWVRPLLRQQSDHDNEYLLDFRRATRVQAMYTPEAFSKHGPPESQISNPAYVQRTIPMLTVWGDNALCILAFEDFPGKCSSASTPISLRFELPYSVDAQQRAFAQIKKRCPAPEPSKTRTPSPQDGLLALYGFRSLEPIKRHFEMLDTQGNVARQVDIAYVPKIIDGCHVEVTRLQKETYPTHIQQDQSSQFTTRYDFTKFASMRVATEPDFEAGAYQADAALRGMTLPQPQQNLVTTYVDGPGAKCIVGTNGKDNCNSAEVRVAAVAVPNITQKDIYSAFNRAAMPCIGAQGRDSAMSDGK